MHQSGQQLHFVDFNLVVMLSSFFCLGSCKSGRIDRTCRQHGGTLKSKSTKYSRWPDGSTCTFRRSSRRSVSERRLIGFRQRRVSQSVSQSVEQGVECPVIAFQKRTGKWSNDGVKSSRCMPNRRVPFLRKGGDEMIVISEERTLAWNHEEKYWWYSNLKQVKTYISALLVCSDSYLAPKTHQLGNFLRANHVNKCNVSIRSLSCRLNGFLGLSLNDVTIGKI